MMQRGAVLVVAMGCAGMAMAQTTNLEAPGNLAPKQDPGCIAVTKAGPKLTPPDLALGVQACAKVGNYDGAVDLFIVMQLRARFDALRVVDPTAHQAQDVLSMQTFGALDGVGQAGVQAAFGSFGDAGSPRHSAICAVVRAGGAPDYAPVYMIQHGMVAFTGITGDGLVAGFEPAAAWAGLLTDYLKCIPQ